MVAEDGTVVATVRKQLYVRERRKFAQPAPTASFTAVRDHGSDESV